MFFKNDVILLQSRDRKSELLRNHWQGQVEVPLNLPYKKVRVILISTFAK